MIWFAWLACTGSGIIPLTTTLPDGALAVGFAADGGAEFDNVRLSVAEVVVRGDGPNGPIALSYSAPLEADLLARMNDAAKLDVTPWEYRSVAVELKLARRAGQPGLTAAGEADRARWALDVDTLTLSGGVDVVDVPEQGIARLDWVFHLDAWLDGVRVGDGDDAEDDEGDLWRISPEEHGGDYARVVGQIVDSTELIGAGAAGDEHGPDDDTDDDTDDADTGAGDSGDSGSETGDHDTGGDSGDTDSGGDTGDTRDSGDGGHSGDSGDTGE
jgi:hypothetical protein